MVFNAVFLTVGGDDTNIFRPDRTAITFNDKAKAVRSYFHLSNAFKEDGFIGMYLHEKYPDTSWFDADFDLFDEDEETVLSGCSYLWQSEEHKSL